MSKALLKSTGIVSSMTFISRIMGMLRDMVCAQYFGAGTGFDAFAVANRIPNFMRRLFAEGAFALAFVPVFSEYKQQRSPEELRELVGRVAGTLGLILVLVTGLGILAAPALVWVFAHGFTADPVKFELTVAMLRITFPYLLLISLTAMAGGILNSCGRFAIPALTPVILNICMIVGAIGLSPYLDQPVTALAWAVLAAGVLQLLFQLPYLHAIGLLVWPRWGWGSAGVQRIMTLMLPTLFGSSVAQINLLVNTLLASFLVTGSVSWLYYSDRLVELPLGVFGVALGTVILPSLSREHAAQAPAAFSRTLDWGLRWVLLIGLPATVGLALLAAPVLSTLFQYGQFSAHDVVMASRSLTAYALGLLAFMLVKVLAPGFYARQDTATPVRIGIMAVAANIALNLLLIVPLAHVGLALGASLASFLNAALLYRLLRRQGIYQPEPGWGRFLLQLLVANTLLGGLLWWGMGDLTVNWLEATLGERLLRLGALVGGGIGVYVLAALAVGIRPRQLRG